MALSNQLRAIRDGLNGVCQLCGSPTPKLLSDHDHKTGLVRGFVCHTCNSHQLPLGELHPEMVSERVLEYLKNPPLGHLRILHCGGRKHGMEATHIRLRPDIRARLDLIAKHNSMSLANLIRHVIDKWLEGEK